MSTDPKVAELWESMVTMGWLTFIDLYGMRPYVILYAMWCCQKMMTDKEFNKLLEYDSHSDAEVSRRLRKRKARDVVCTSVCHFFHLYFFYSCYINTLINALRSSFASKEINAIKKLMHRHKLYDAGVPVYNRNCPKLNCDYLTNK